MTEQTLSLAKQLESFCDVIDDVIWQGCNIVALVIRKYDVSPSRADAWDSLMLTLMNAGIARHYSEKNSQRG